MELLKNIAGTLLPASCFAYCEDMGSPATWRLPCDHPAPKFALNLLKGSLARFKETPIPAAERAKVWHRLTRRAAELGLKVPKEMPTAAAAPKQKTKSQWHAAHAGKLASDARTRRLAQSWADHQRNAVERILRDL